ncbi:hypothetical protein [Pontivivens insulae]|uniref:Flagellar FliJ protein n=1 Tax=Pontivivens insulae TaxID=1639689 RepID=A0A2R8A9R2_9RHOB|nr:hypothetical protein [Pontivivens insulae]RED12774.1 hypothetical protein DFR53_1904 [Pontivivens insulae]SPF28865.1 hypothetical protein POI8812_01168 [Pontivivens insulae]
MTDHKMVADLHRNRYEAAAAALAPKRAMIDALNDKIAQCEVSVADGDVVARAQWDRWRLARKAHLLRELADAKADLADGQDRLVALHRKSVAAERRAARQAAIAADEQRRTLLRQIP